MVDCVSIRQMAGRKFVIAGHSRCDTCFVFAPFYNRSGCPVRLGVRRAGGGEERKRKKSIRLVRPRLVVKVSSRMATRGNKWPEIRRPNGRTLSLERRIVRDRAASYRIVRDRTLSGRYCDDRVLALSLEWPLQHLGRLKQAAQGAHDGRGERERIKKTIMKRRAADGRTPTTRPSRIQGSNSRAVGQSNSRTNNATKRQLQQRVSVLNRTVLSYSCFLASYFCCFFFRPPSISFDAVTLTANRPDIRKSAIWPYTSFLVKRDQRRKWIDG